VTCAECRALISRADNVRRLAWDIEAAFPACACEAHSIGDGSPGAVQNPEILYRLIASPTDIDPLTNEVTSTAFEKAYENGLSVFRECATNEHIVALITDRLTIKRGRRPFPTILGLFRIECAAIREVTHDPLGRAFCVYDQTVPRKRDATLPQVSTHATVFQRVPRPKLEGRNRMIGAANLKLFLRLRDQRVPVQDFRDGLIVALNARSLQGEFELPD